MSTTGLSVLVVDDEATFFVYWIGFYLAKAIRLRLQSAERAVGQLARENFDLAILDINMYPMSGVELLAAIKDRSPMTQVVMITGYPTNHTRDQSEKLGAVGYLTKPIDISELRALLRQLAETHEL